MSLKVYESLDFSEHITITKELPLYKKILEGIDTSAILSELENYTPENQPNKPWFGSYSMDKVNEALEELTDIGFNIGGNYKQKQLCSYQTGFPWQTWQSGIGVYTQYVFQNHLPGFHRPRYVEAKPGWQVREHTDWGTNSNYGLRCHLILETNDDCKHFITGDDGVEHELTFAPGEVWFYNVEKPHRAYNLGSTIRKSLSFELINDDLI